MRITVLKLIEMLDSWVFCIDACLLRVFKVFCNFSSILENLVKVVDIFVYTRKDRYLCGKFRV